MSEGKSSRREVSVKGEREPAGHACVSVWSMPPEAGTGVGPLSFFMLEMGCEKACVLPPVSG